jgi:hypothetical protein
MLQDRCQGQVSQQSSLSLVCCLGWENSPPSNDKVPHFQQHLPMRSPPLWIKGSLWEEGRNPASFVPPGALISFGKVSVVRHFRVRVPS